MIFELTEEHIYDAIFLEPREQEFSLGNDDGIYYDLEFRLLKMYPDRLIC
jgi:hypothetical protein